MSSMGNPCADRSPRAGVTGMMCLQPHLEHFLVVPHQADGRAGVWVEAQVAAADDALAARRRRLQLLLQPGQLRGRYAAAKLDKPVEAGLGSGAACGAGWGNMKTRCYKHATHAFSHLRTISPHATDARPCSSHARTHLRCRPTSPLPLFLSSLGLFASSSARACSCSGWPAAVGRRMCGRG